MFICQPRLSRRKYLSKCFIKWFMNFRYYFHAFMILWLLFWHQQLVKVSDYPVKCRKICSNSMTDIHCPQMMNPNDSDEPLIFLLVPQTGFWFSFGVFLRETSPQLFDNSLWHSLNIHFPLRMNYNNCNHSWVFSSPGQHLSLSLFSLLWHFYPPVTTPVSSRLWSLLTCSPLSYFSHHSCRSSGDVTTAQREGANPWAGYIRPSHAVCVYDDTYWEVTLCF